MPRFVVEKTVRLMVDAADASAAEQVAQEWLGGLETGDFAAAERLARAGAVRLSPPDPAPPPAQPERPQQPTLGQPVAAPPPPPPPQPPQGILAVGKRK